MQAPVADGQDDVGESFLADKVPDNDAGAVPGFELRAVDF